ncbi:glycosyltransferase [Apilactobacillus quenuiae]|uniref:glycosyltransferase n=1 Tax=Apilactobacillus quenuiae TaxID=2008377 RepID=UPI000D01EE35|nr:glycosyltransferase [Apilactobacillus quenuiae]
MNFFLNANFNEKNSGIEHAEIERALLFKNNNEPFKIVFQSWNPLLHHWLNLNDIKDNEILNLFDYYQHTQNIKPKKIQAKDIDFGMIKLEYKEQTDKNRYIVYQAEKIVGRINYFDDNISKDKLVSSVELFDGFEHLYRVDFYDIRGFKSMVQWYTPDNKIATEVWYSIDGKPVVEDYFRLNAQGKLTRSGYKTISDEGTVRSYLNYYELVEAFINDINDQYFSLENPNIFIMDRSENVEEFLPHLRKPSYNVLHLHNSHAGDPQNPDTSIMNNNYEYTLINANRYDGIIVPSKKQTRDVKRRFQPQCDMYTIPVSIVSNKTLNEKQVPMNKRKNKSVIATARIAPEKQLDQLVWAVYYARKKVPNITLDLYGFIDHSNNDIAQKRLKKAEKETGLEDVVKIHSYTSDVPSIQRNSQIYGVTSTSEGLSLAVMEAQSHGDVVLSYNINYGQDELVQDGKNGYLVKPNDAKSLGKKIAKLFANPKLLQKMSNQAYELSNRYSEKNVWSAWQNFLEHAQKSWPDKVKLYRPDITKGIQQMDQGV